MFEMTYDRTLANTPAKLSVTQISKKFSDDEEFDFQLKRPVFLKEKGYLTGAERGTAIHSFFQYCSFENAIADSKAEVERLVSSGFLTKAQGDSINIRKIQAFFKTNLYKRMCSSPLAEREKKFTVAAAELQLNDAVFDRLKDSDGMIKGIIDLMFEEDDGVIIVDYKSDRFITEEQLRSRYAKQLEIYKAAIELTTGKKVKELIKIDRDAEEDCQSLVNKIFKENYINKKTIDIISCILDYIKENIFKKYLQYIFKALEKNNFLTTLIEISKDRNSNLDKDNKSIENYSIKIKELKRKVLEQIKVDDAKFE
jgi:hypothetical protein